MKRVEEEEGWMMTGADLLSDHLLHSTLYKKKMSALESSLSGPEQMEQNIAGFLHIYFTDSIWPET